MGQEGKYCCFFTAPGVKYGLGSREGDGSQNNY